MRYNAVREQNKLHEEQILMLDMESRGGMTLAGWEKTRMQRPDERGS